MKTCTCHNSTNQDTLDTIRHCNPESAGRQGGIFQRCRQTL